MRINQANKKETIRRRADGEVSIFAGIVKCADCGGNMVFNRKRHKTVTREFYRCSTYMNQGKGVCDMHKVDYDVLYNAVLADVQRYAVLAVEDEQRLIDRILKSNDEFKVKNVSRYEKNIREAKNRIREIDSITMKLYEDKAAGEIPADLFKRMAAKFEDERQQLTADIAQLENELAECKQVQQDVTGWIERIKQCLSIETLTRAIAVELINRIEVSTEHEENGEKFLDIAIFYKFGLKNLSQEKSY
jgi:hypothetical protein